MNADARRCSVAHRRASVSVVLYCSAVMRWLATFSWRAQSSQIDQNLRLARGTGVSPVESEKLRKNRSAPPSGAEGALKRNNLYAGETPALQFFTRLAV